MQVDKTKYVYVDWDKVGEYEKMVGVPMVPLEYKNGGLMGPYQVMPPEYGELQPADIEEYCVLNIRVAGRYRAWVMPKGLLVYPSQVPLSNDRAASRKERYDVGPTKLRTWFSGLKVGFYPKNEAGSDSDKIVGVSYGDGPDRCVYIATEKILNSRSGNYLERPDFNWGYNGTGPTDTAHSIIDWMSYTYSRPRLNEEEIKQLGIKFRDEVLGRLPRDLDWIIDLENMQEWLRIEARELRYDEESCEKSESHSL